VTTERTPRRPRNLALAALTLVAGALAGCANSIGGTRCTESGGEVTCVRTDAPGCDAFTTDQARVVVYRGDGTPFYAGQAIVLENCATCHRQMPILGAPFGMDFNPEVVAAVDTAGSVAQARALLTAQTSIHRHRQEIHEQVSGGLMPPRNYVPAGDSLFEFEDGTPLPGIRTPEGQELLRHWLSCGSPVVERTAPLSSPCSSSADCEVTRQCDVAAGQCVGVGDVVARRDTTLQPTWSSIYAGVIQASCAGAACHVGGAAGGLDMSDAAGGYAALLGMMPGPSSLSCAGETSAYVVAGDSDASLLVHKIEGTDEMGMPVCGARMPIGPMLTTQQIDVIRMWIDMGAEQN
jgi:hypothetical protein